MYSLRLVTVSESSSIRNKV